MSGLPLLLLYILRRIGNDSAPANLDHFKTPGLDFIIGFRATNPDDMACLVDGVSEFFDRILHMLLQRFGFTDWPRLNADAEEFSDLYCAVRGQQRTCPGMSSNVQ